MCSLCLFSFNPRSYSGPPLKRQWKQWSPRALWRSQASNRATPTCPPPARSLPPALPVMLLDWISHLSDSFFISSVFTITSSDRCIRFFGFFPPPPDTSTAPPKPSRPGPSRQLQRWPEHRGGRVKRGGKSKTLISHDVHAVPVLLIGRQRQVRVEMKASLIFYIYSVFMFLQQHSKILFRHFLRPQGRHFLPGVFTAGDLPDEPETKHVLACLDHVHVL